MNTLSGRFVILGGYGQFGTRIADALARYGYGEVVIAGKNPEQARATAETLSARYPDSRLSTAELDGFAIDWQVTEERGACYLPT